MRCKVRCLRRQGKRIDWTLLDNMVPLSGDVGTHYVERGQRRYYVATLRDPDRSADAPMLQLFEPVLYNIAPNHLALRGFEAGGYVQEWLMEMLS